MAWTLQDFTTFTEVDPNSKITVDADEITVVASAYADTSYVRKDFGTDYFTGDFKFKVHIKHTSGLSGCWCINKSATSIQEMQYPNDDGIIVYTTTIVFGGTHHYLCIRQCGAEYVEDNVEITAGTDYYLLIERISGVITCKVYTDELMTSLFDTLNGGSNNLACRYLFGYINYGLEAAGTATTYVKDLYFYAEDLVVATPTASPDAGSYDMPIKVELSCITENSNIYYTTDGSIPTNGSTLYISPLVLTRSVEIKAIAYKTGYTNSDIASFIYYYVCVNDEYIIEEIGENLMLCYIAIDDQNFYVTDSANHHILIFDKSSMNEIEVDGSEGNGNNEYDTPRGICLYKSKLFIVDDNDRIKVVTNYKTSRGRESSTIIKVDDAPIIVGGSLIIGDDETEDQGNVFIENEPTSHKVAWSID